MSMRKTMLVLFSLITVLTLTACGGLTNQNENSITVYSGRSETLVGPVFEQFEQQTGITLRVRYGSTAELAATILEEGPNSPADLFFAQDPGGIGAVADAGLLDQLSADVLSKVDSRFADPNKLWVGISGRARVVVYNTNTLSVNDLPATLKGFTDPKWKGKIGLPPTNTSFQTMVTALRKVWGEEETRQWLEGIMANEPTFYEKNTPTVAATAAGEVEIGFVNHYYLYRFIAEEGESFAARNYFLPGGGPGSLVLVSSIARLKSSQKPDLAETLIEFLLNNFSQSYFSNETFEYPLIPGIPVYPGLSPLDELNTHVIPLEDLSDLQGTVALMQAVGMLP